MKFVLLASFKNMIFFVGSMAARMMFCQTLLCLLGAQAALDPTHITRSQPKLSQSQPIAVSYTSANKAQHIAGAIVGDGNADETLNSAKSQSSASWTSPTAAESGASWPPLIVASDNAQKFFDRIHGFAEKPVGDDANNDGVTITTTTENSSNGASPTQTYHTAYASPLDDVHANTIDGEVVHATTVRSPAIIPNKPSLLLKNWIYTHPSVDASNRPVVRVRKEISSTYANNEIEKPRQMQTSLTDRIFANLMAKNPWVNFTQSLTPQIVYSAANVPIAQMPFVQLAPPTTPPQKTEKPPRRGWFSFASRPLRIYGEGTESKFPPMIERIVQRIQHYFSVFKYEDTSRPLASEGINYDPVATVQMMADDGGLDESSVDVKPLSEGAQDSKPSGEFVVFVGNFNVDDKNEELAFEQLPMENINMFDDEVRSNETDIGTTEDVSAVEFTTIENSTTEEENLSEFTSELPSTAQDIISRQLNADSSTLSLTEESSLVPTEQAVTIIATSKSKSD